MKNVLSFLFLLPLAGCLSSSAPDIAYWPIECEGRPAQVAPEPTFGVARVSQLAVRSPYDVGTFAVLRSDGSVAFDDYNNFASIPPQILKGPVADVLRESGMFKGVIGAASSVPSDATIEIVVRKIALDCREAGSRKALVALSVVLMDKKREGVLEGKGEASVGTGDGNYGKAFSQAFSQALTMALGTL